MAWYLVGALHSCTSQLHNSPAVSAELALLAVFDEADKLKDKTIQRTQAALKLSTQLRYGLTGTPMPVSLTLQCHVPECSSWQPAECFLCVEQADRALDAGRCACSWRPGHLQGVCEVRPIQHVLLLPLPLQLALLLQALLLLDLQSICSQAQAEPSLRAGLMREPSRPASPRRRP